MHCIPLYLTRAVFVKYSMYVNYGRGLVILWRRYLPLSVVVHGCRWMQAASGTAGRANVGLCPASDCVLLQPSRWRRHLVFLINVSLHASGNIAVLWWACAFSALTLLVGRQEEEHPACKNWVMRCWRGCLSWARCRLFARGPSDATASQNPIISCLI